jgi:hypothetical protein
MIAMWRHSGTGEAHRSMVDPQFQVVRQNACGRTENVQFLLKPSPLDSIPAWRSVVRDSGRDFSRETSTRHDEIAT